MVYGRAALVRGAAMWQRHAVTTLFDWMAMAIFCALAITWLSRSVAQPRFHDPVFPYAACAIGCAGGNWLGNEGHSLLAYAVLGVTAIFYLLRIRPFRQD
ncbi:MAG: XrtV sorting system accessory protein [Erythrobacter sp.]